MSTFEPMRGPCRRCGNKSGRKVRYRAVSGITHIRHQCERCSTLTIYNLPGGGKSSTLDLPLAKDRLGEGAPCVRCGRRDTELHHWAPRKHFKDEADLWPVDYLCRDCHRRWHVETGIAVGYRGNTSTNIRATCATPDGSYEAVGAHLSRRSRLGDQGYALLLFQWLAGGHITEPELRSRLRLHEQARLRR